MNKVEITKAPVQKSDEPRQGTLYEATSLNDWTPAGDVAMAAYPYGHGKLRLFLLRNGCRISDESLFGKAGPAGWRRLPPGTVVTITVEED